MYRVTRHMALMALALAFLAQWLGGGMPAQAGRNTPPAGPSYVVQPEADQPAKEISRGYFWLELKPGQTRTIRIVIKNIGATPLPVRNYLNDGVPIPTGGIDFTTWGKHLSGVGRWISIQPKSLLLAPGATRRIFATIHVPKGLAPGQYVAGVAFEDKRVQNQSMGSHILIDVHYRQVLAVVITLPGRPVSAVRIGGVTLASELQGSKVTVDVRNTGNMLWKGRGTLQVGGGRSSTGALPFTVDTLLPGALAQVAIPLPYLRLQQGSYDVHVQIRSLDLNGPVRSVHLGPQVAWHGDVALATPKQDTPATPVPTLVLQPAHPVATPGAGPAHLVASAAAPQASAARGSVSEPIPPLVSGAGAVMLLIVVAGLGAVIRRRSAARHA